ncbi:MAG: segregation/condensation protein A, partial [Candidatus Limnocylindria bacterium]
MSAFPFEPDSGPPESGAGSPYAVKLALFEGPLDLLLHLIRVNEVEITDIPIARISEQYLATLEGLRDLDLDVAGEFLLMAATLAWIKSRMLLPPDGLDADGEGPDPRAELVARLLEYQRFKEVAAQLAEHGLHPTALQGLGWVSAVYLASLLLTFGVLYWQSYVMQLMGQRIM